MHFTIPREALLKPLQQVAGVAERKSTRPILANVLLRVTETDLSLTATDTEISLESRVCLTGTVGVGEVTVPARKFIDLCRTMPSGCQLQISTENNQIKIRTENSHFSLATLPAKDFPDIESVPATYECSLGENDFHYLLQATHFSMATNDARYYLNGLNIHIHNQVIDLVATDGHRLALCQITDPSFIGDQQAIIPRKAVLELLRLLSDVARPLTLAFSQNYLRVTSADFVFTSRLINGRFPDYNRVIPSHHDYEFGIDRDLLKEALSRVSILSNEKYRGIHLQVRTDCLRVLANNHDQEEAIEEIPIEYHGDDLDLGFNVSYIIDILNTVPAGDVRLEFTGSKGGVVIHSLVDDQRSYVVMPMRV